MPPYAGPSVARSDDIAGTLRLLACLVAAVVLMFVDHQGKWGQTVRTHAEALVAPLWAVAGMPARIGRTVREDAATIGRLTDENAALRNALLIERARNARLQAAAGENARLRGLLGASAQGGLDVQLAPILDIALDPNRQRLTLDVGSDHGVREGQAVIDAGGLVGQVSRVRPGTAEVLLLTDPSHAVPVAVSRNGIRLVVYGRSTHLELANIPMSADVKVGDLVVTSGLGERFPPGFPVGIVARLEPDASRTFLIGRLTPAAQLDRGRDVLLLRGRKTPAPALPPATEAAGMATTQGSADATAVVGATAGGAATGEDTTELATTGLATTGVARPADTVPAAGRDPTRDPARAADARPRPAAQHAASASPTDAASTLASPPVEPEPRSEPAQERPR